jgi:hypothetical protein
MESSHLNFALRQPLGSLVKSQNKKGYKLKRKWVCVGVLFSCVFSCVDNEAIPCIAPVTTVRNTDKRVVAAGAGADVRVSLRSII